MDLNFRTIPICSELEAHVRSLRIAVDRTPAGTLLIDCGVATLGGLEAGRILAEVCMAGLGRVSFVPAGDEFRGGPAVQVHTDFPVAACMAAQYAGWEIRADDYFAMGSGPMRAAAGHEPLFDTIGYREKPGHCYGVLESSALPPDQVCTDIAAKCGVGAEQLTLLVASTRSTAGMVQIVARSVETALHKLHELGYDLAQVEGGYGVAPLPPPAKDDLSALGRTNDAILYAGEVTLLVNGDDDAVRDVGAQTPSSASPDHGQPFAEIFARCGHDFYQVDPNLFSPAVVTFANQQTGNSFRYGTTSPDVIARSFGTID